MAKKKLIAVIGATGAQGGGLVRAILADREGPFTTRAITRKPDSEKARALAALGAEVMTGDMDDAATLEKAFAGAYGVYCMTPFWEHLSVEREIRQAGALARAARKAGAQHVVWSTLEDTRLRIPLSDTRLPTLQGRYKVPHFDGKGEADALFAKEGVPTSHLLPAFYWENFIYFGAGPRRGADGKLTLALPLGGAKLPGIAAEDIGRCAYGIFRRGPSAAGQRFGIAGGILSGDEMAAGLSHALGERVTFQDVPFDVYRGLGFPGAEDLGNMFQYQAILGDEFYRAREPKLAKELNPQLQSFDAWLAANAASVPVA